MGTSIKLRYDDKKTRVELDKVLSNLKDINSTNKKVGDYLVARSRSNFENEVDPSGRSWKPLSPATIERKRREGSSLKILQRTGKMKNSVYVTVNRASVVVGYSDPKVVYHQLGTDRTPKREVVGIGEKDRQAVADIYARLLTR
jgi:phage gpG-like protein